MSGLINRVTRRFDDYLEELQMHSRSQTSDLASDGTNEILLRPQILGPTITSNVHMSFPMIENSIAPHRSQYDSFESIVQHPMHSDRCQQVPVMNGIPLQRDNLGMSSARVGSTCTPNSDALLGRVVHRSVRSTPPMGSNTWVEARCEQVLETKQLGNNATHLVLHCAVFVDESVAVCVLDPHTHEETSMDVTDGPPSAN